MKKTLLINQNIYDLLHLQHEQTQSLLSLEDFVVDALTSAHYRYKDGAEKPHEYMPYAPFETLTIDTDIDWLLDATKDDINTLLYVSLNNMSGERFTSSYVVYTAIEALRFFKVKPDAHAKFYKPARILSELLNSSKVSDIKSLSLSGIARDQLVFKNSVTLVSKIIISIVLFMTTSGVFNVSLTKINTFKTIAKLQLTIGSQMLTSIMLAMLLAVVLSYTVKRFKPMVNRLLKLLAIAMLAVFLTSQSLFDIATVKIIYIVVGNFLYLVGATFITASFASLILNVMSLAKLLRDDSLNITTTAPNQKLSPIQLWSLSDSGCQIVIFEPMFKNKDGHISFDFNGISQYWRVSVDNK